MGVLVILALALSMASGNLIGRLKCKGCLSLAPLAGSKVCKSKCEQKNIFPVTCSKICGWMISRHPETVCRIAKSCTLDTIKELKSGGILSALGFDEGEEYDAPGDESSIDFLGLGRDDDLFNPLMDAENRFDETNEGFNDWNTPRRLRSIRPW